MKLLGLNISRSTALETKAPNNLTPATGSGWFWPVIREAFLQAFQQNTEVRTADVLTYAAVYACVTLIAQDIGKLRPKLMRQIDAENDIWEETSSPAFTPVLRKPNGYQTRIMFLQNWMTSKLIWGNTYILKARDNRRVVVGLSILDPQRVTVLVSPNGQVWYELQADNLADVTPSSERFRGPDGGLVVPASEIIHDVMCPLYHPLIGVSPITACGLAAIQGLRIQDNSSMFFGNGARPGGVLTAPGAISQPTADRLKAYFDSNFSGDNAGKVAVLGDGLTYEQMTMSAIDAQLIDQLRWTAENVCTAFHVPPYMIGVGPPPTYNNIEALNAQYYAQCLQNQIESIELHLDEGLGLGAGETKDSGEVLGTELDVDSLLRMDSLTRMTVAEKGLSAGMSPNEVRAKYHDLKRVTGGDSPMLQQQEFSLEALAKRDAKEDPFAKSGDGSSSNPQPQPAATSPAPADDASKGFPWKMAYKAKMAERLKERAA